MMNSFRGRGANYHSVRIKVIKHVRPKAKLVIFENNQQIWVPISVMDGDDIQY